MPNQIEIYQSDDGQTQVEVRLGQETVWLNRQQLSQLFARDVKTIGKHINNVFKEGELSKEAVVANFATTAKDGKTYQVGHYNLDFLNRNGRLLNSRGEAVINDTGLAALTLLVAESDPRQKETLIRLIMHMLTEDSSA